MFDLDRYEKAKQLLIEYIDLGDYQLLQEARNLLEDIEPEIQWAGENLYSRSQETSLVTINLLIQLDHFRTVRFSHT